MVCTVAPPGYNDACFTLTTSHICPMTRPRPWVDLALAPVACNSRVHSMQIRPQIYNKNNRRLNITIGGQYVPTMHYSDLWCSSGGLQMDKLLHDARSGHRARPCASEGQAKGQATVSRAGESSVLG